MTPIATLVAGLVLLGTLPSHAWLAARSCARAVRDAPAHEQAAMLPLQGGTRWVAGTAQPLDGNPLPRARMRERGVESTRAPLGASWTEIARDTDRFAFEVVTVRGEHVRVEPLEAFALRGPMLLQPVVARAERTRHSGPTAGKPVLVYGALASPSPAGPYRAAHDAWCMRGDHTTEMLIVYEPLAKHPERWRQTWTVTARIYGASFVLDAAFAAWCVAHGAAEGAAWFMLVTMGVAGLLARTHRNDVAEWYERQPFVTFEHAPLPAIRR